MHLSTQEAPKKNNIKSILFLLVCYLFTLLKALFYTTIVAGNSEFTSSVSPSETHIAIRTQLLTFNASSLNLTLNNHFSINTVQLLQREQYRGAKAIILMIDKA
jgi:ABC-type sulfate transport system permease subunit